MLYLSAILTVAAVHFLAVISPGPDFIMVSRNSLVHSRKIGIFSALGLALGMMVHIAYSLIGIGLLIAKSILFFSLLKFIGGGYLIYIGYIALKAKPQNEAGAAAHGSVSLQPIQAIRMGFLTNVTNPKVTLFFLSIFTLVITPATPLSIRLIMGLEMASATFLWFSLVALVFSHSTLKRRMVNIQHYAEKVMGVALIALGIKLIVASPNR